MPKNRPFALTAVLFLAHLGCAPEASIPTPIGVTGGASGATGGSGSGGAAVSAGGAPGTGGAVAVGTGGAGTGGAATGGSGSGGASSGGASPATGGSSAGGAAGGRSGAAGRAGGGGAVGTGGTAAGGAPGGGGASGLGCAGKTYKLCEDFETGAAGALPTGWTAFKGYGAGAPSDVVLAADQFHSGTMALKSSSAATGQGRIQKSLTTLGATASKHWGRVFYKVQSPATRPASGVLHVTWVGLFGTGENRVVDIVENTSGKHQWLFNNPNDQGSLGSSYDWTFDAAWHCAEWFVDVGAKSYRFFADSKEVPSIGFTGKADSQMTPYMRIVVGATFYQSLSTPFVMWFDDLAIDDNQIGCQ